MNLGARAHMGGCLTHMHDLTLFQPLMALLSGPWVHNVEHGADFPEHRDVSMSDDKSQKMAGYMHMFARLKSLVKQFHSGTQNQRINCWVHSRSLEFDSRSVVEHALTTDRTWSDAYVALWQYIVAGNYFRARLSWFSRRAIWFPAWMCPVLKSQEE
jgi:hypothetical protein